MLDRVPLFLRTQNHRRRRRRTKIREAADIVCPRFRAWARRIRRVFNSRRVAPAHFWTHDYDLLDSFKAGLSARALWNKNNAHDLVRP